MSWESQPGLGVSVTYGKYKRRSNFLICFFLEKGKGSE